MSKIIKPAVTGTSADLKPVRVFDYDRLEEEADRIIESARKEAERIIEEAKGKSECFFDEKKDEITKLTEDALAKANEEGFKSGHEEGMKAGYNKASEDVAKQSETLIETISKILYHLEREKDIFEKRVVGELLELSFGIARAVSRQMAPAPRCVGPIPAKWPNRAPAVVSTSPSISSGSQARRAAGRDHIYRAPQHRLRRSC